MQEKREVPIRQPIVFFDADKTLWRIESKNVGDDYVSKGAFEGNPRTFTLDTNGNVVREQDSTRFVLKKGVAETLKRLSMEGIQIGMISDNVYEDVEKVCELFGVWKFFNLKLINIRLWHGPADKALMISEILGGDFGENRPSGVLLVDDSERYAQQMARVGHSFVLSPTDTFPKDSILEFFSSR